MYITHIISLDWLKLATTREKGFALNGEHMALRRMHHGTSEPGLARRHYPLLLLLLGILVV
jgi:hypothetical protein